MKNEIILILTFILINSFCYGASCPKIQIQEINSDYGIKAWLSADHTTEIISTVITFHKAGYAYEDISGIANLTAQLLEEGAGEYDATTLANMLESNGIIISYDVTLEDFIIQIKTLSANFDIALTLLEAMLTEPILDQDAIQRAKSQQLSLLQRREANPNYIAKKKLFESVFKDHPYANQPYGRKEDLNKINKDDILKYIKQTLNRVNLNISISGDIHPLTLSKMLDKHFVNLPLMSTKAKEIPTVSVELDPRISNSHQINIDMDIAQSVIYFTKNGINLHDGNFYPGYLLNYIVGGRSLDSILMKEIRKKQGLTYGIYTSLENYTHADLWIGQTATYNNSTKEMLLAVNQVLEIIKRDGISIETLQNAKEYIMNSLVIQLDTNQKIAETLAYAQNNQLGIDYINEFCTKINNVTIDDINKVINSFLDTRKMLFVIIGKQ